MTIATIPVQRDAATSFGIMHTDAQRKVIRFEEKPKDPALLDELRIPGELLTELGHPADRGALPGLDGYLYFQPRLPHPGAR